jgi:hypothetical protein
MLELATGRKPGVFQPFAPEGFSVDDVNRRLAYMHRRAP